MKIYFAGSIRGGRDDVEDYKQIIEHLKNYGTVLTEFIGDKSITIETEKHYDDAWIHDRDLEWILESDVLVSEVTTTSHGVGYEIGRAVENKKPILCLYKKKEGKLISAMLNGCKDIKVVDYSNIKQAKKAIDDFFIKVNLVIDRL